MKELCHNILLFPHYPVPGTRKEVV